MPDTITVRSRITDRLFYRFAVFDTLILRKRYVSPLFFAAAFGAFSLICFLMRDRAQQAMLLCFVLLGIAIVLPGSYFITFFYSLSRKSKELHLTESGLHTYTVSMNSRGISVTNAIAAEHHLGLNWDQLYHAYRTKDCIYLYVSQVQAFLLPDGCADTDPDTLWTFLGEKMTAGKLTDRRR